MHYYSHHIGDFIRDTSRLNDAQCMAYLRLIWMYYEDEEPLIDNVELLAFKIGSDKDTVAMLLQCYFYANAMRWHHKRIDSELSMYKEKSEKARNSAKARWNNANAMRTHSECNANQEPITNNQLNTIAGTKDSSLCPHQEIINLYSKNLPMGIQPKTWAADRASKLKARWREDSKRQNLEWWDKFFRYIANSEFLTGKVHSGDRKPFEISLDWIVTAKNFANIIDGKYHKDVS